MRDQKRKIKTRVCLPAADTHTDNEYEVFPSSDTQASSLCSPGHMGESSHPHTHTHIPLQQCVHVWGCVWVCSGFNLRVQKPRGPRDIPAEWRRL